MTPFPETEDMTIKRLYVALKRGDMQLLQMGTHKLHEKYYTGYKFELLEDLKRILSYIENQTLPNDIKDLLTRTINDILSGKVPENFVSTQEYKNSDENEQSFIQDEKVETNENSSPVIFTPTDTAQNENEQQITYENIQTSKEEFLHMENPISETKPVIKEQIQPVQSMSSSKNGGIAIFYDDKAVCDDFNQNKIYRNNINLISLNKEVQNEDITSLIKTSADAPQVNISEILNALKDVDKKISFITTSKSENILKTFIEDNINFEIPLVNENAEAYNAVKLIPLLGLSNLFICPGCGKREYFGGFHNKVLNLQCKDCLKVMYPDVSGIKGYETNANPYYWIRGEKLMAQSDVWILINPPLDKDKVLIEEFIKTSFELNPPKRVYILSKETIKKEHYCKVFKEISNECMIKSEFISEDLLIRDFLNDENSIGE